VRNLQLSIIILLYITQPSHERHFIFKNGQTLILEHTETGILRGYCMCHFYVSYLYFEILRFLYLYIYVWFVDIHSIVSFLFVIYFRLLENGPRGPKHVGV
jgi:hypothetical protein